MDARWLRPPGEQLYCCIKAACVPKFCLSSVSLSEIKLWRQLSSEPYFRVYKTRLIQSFTYLAPMVRLIYGCVLCKIVFTQIVKTSVLYTGTYIYEFQNPVDTAAKVIDLHFCSNNSSLQFDRYHWNGTVTVTLRTQLSWLDFLPCAAILHLYRYDFVSLDSSS